ncbi:hypothetical protein RvY_16490 [Ramazzottius varieornatus]|uniref:Uncharacterized protein n=1 Tax=Ramazzottius varieornatus TaxID=947166 RepID=A0A1D1W2Z5_RAMVA|nr:hypothetical protein RvY_16490 [Ramazzottius varieornatus]
MLKGIKTLAECVMKHTIVRGTIWASRCCDSNDDEKLEAEIKAIFGDTLGKETFDLKRYIEISLADVTATVVAAGHEETPYKELKDIMNRVRTVYDAFQLHIASPRTGFLKEKFLDACEKHEPKSLILSLHSEIRRGRAEKTLLDRTIIVCESPRNAERFVLWRERIEMAVQLAFFFTCFTEECSLTTI